MPTSEERIDERREVAKRMRGPFDVCECVGHTYINGTLFGMQVCAKDEIDLRNGMRHLAELIDPTCSMACRGSFTASHDFTCWECGECGAYAFTPKKVLAPRYCPHCGARVVSGDE